jgi:hypothetical protein
MPLNLNAIKADFARNRKKAAILAALSSVMIILILRAFLTTGPAPVAASTFYDPNAPDAHPGAEAATLPNADDRLALSRNLWKTLRDVRGTAPAAVFKFDPAYYTLDPSRPRPPVADAPQDVPLHAPQHPLFDEDAERQARMAAIRDQARGLIVRSTVVNPGASPIAVVNDRILTLGDHINGFEVTAIHAREVEFKKEQVICIGKMVDMPRGQ